ncbi:MIP/aquaporin family protein [Gracilimonas sp.]|uniref:MIP/aquaporin family protein n=1 Tax=Gracilimonas sp. TaxID=1974203 RepID=UPI00287231CE|nr:aquaporin [Gracilimonas sp.]
MRAYLTETFGAFFLVLAFGFTGDPLAIGLTLIALIYIGYPISGGHYNPAVSFAFFLKQELSLPQFLGYVLSQTIGSILAAVTILFLSSSVFYVEPPTDTNLYQQAFAELLFTGIFVIIMMIFSLSRSQGKRNLLGLVAGLTFAGMLMITIPISGGILNPVTSIGTALIDFINGGNSYVHVLLYTLAPLCGCALAAFKYVYFNPPREA